MTGLTDEGRRGMTRDMLALSQEIMAVVSQERMDPGKLMRLMAAGISQVLVAQAVELGGNELPDSTQRV
jgi:hypothetical protein